MSSIQSGLVPGNKQNEPGGKSPHSRSRFQLSDSMFTTERFADYNPCFVMEGVSGDKVTLNQPHQVRTYTLKAPLMQNILKKKDYFMVPMQAILPLNWEKFYTHPTIGDDVPLGVGTGVPNFWGRLQTIFSSDFATLKTTLNGSGTDSTKLHDLLLFLCFYEMFYSAGSLMKQLRISGNAYLNLYKLGSGTLDFDYVFDQCISRLHFTGGSNTNFTLTIGSNTYVVAISGDILNDIGSEVGGYPTIGIRDALELIRDNLDFSVSAWTTPVAHSTFPDIYGFLNPISVVANTPSAPTSNPDFHSDGVPLNLARLWAYQICCAHYYSNDHIDVLYSAELYREYIRNLYISAFSSVPSLDSSYNTFTYNGIKYEWDALCAMCFNRMWCGTGSSVNFTTGFTSLFTLSGRPARLAYFVAIFGFKKSLRFMDYFTGSRSRPLAVGDASVDVQSGTPNFVDILDLARSTQATRFLNAVNRSGRKFSAYMQELFGIVPKPDFHNPFYLAHTSDVVGGSETENTGADQLTKQSSITTILRSNSSRYAFTFSPDRDCVIIGISYYDLPRVYTRSTDRQAFILDRMDMFNPLMQYVGDQPIFNAELGTSVPSLAPFSYTTRDMEYKQRFNASAGGFCAKSTQLGNWFFSADKLRRLFGTNIGSSFIRSFNTEFDQFYVSLTGWSLGTYFHFIVRYDNRCDASRPMAYAPGIMQ